MRLSTRSKIELLAFFATVCVSLFFLIPFVKLLNKRITIARDAFLQYTEKTYRLKISYNSLSPSIFRTISLHDVTIYDTTHNTKLASVETLSVNYRFFSLIKGDLSGLFYSITLKNGFVDFNAVDNQYLLEKLTTISTISGNSKKDASSKKSNTPTSAALHQKKSITAASLFSLELQPLTVYISNMQFKYADTQQNIFFQIIKGHGIIDKSDITFNLNTKATYTHKVIASLGHLTATIAIDGVLDKKYTSGSCTAYITRFSTAQFGIKNIKCFAGFKNGVVHFNSMQDFQPMDLSGQWNIAANTVSGRFTSKDFIPLQSVTSYHMENTFTQIQNMSMTGELQFELHQQNLLWDTNFEFKIPALAFKNQKFAKSRLKIIANGTNQLLKISHMAFKNNDIDILSRLTCNLKRLLPTGTLHINKCRLPSGQNLAAHIRMQEKNGRLLCEIPFLQAGTAVFSSIKAGIAPLTQKIDFKLQAQDQSGHYAFDGSFIYGKKNNPNANGFLDIHGAFDAISLVNIYDLIHSIYPLKLIPRTLFEPLQGTTEFYISSNLKGFSYNCIKFVAVSNTQDDIYALISAKGNEGSFALTDIDILYKKNSIRGKITADFEKYNDIIFDSSLVLNAVGYHFKGFFAQNTLNVYGDYGIALTALYDKKNGIKGAFRISQLPIPFLPVFFAIDSTFYYKSIQDWAFQIHNGAIRYGTLSVLAQKEISLQFQGIANPKGVFLNHVALGSGDDSLKGYMNLIVRKRPLSEMYQHYTSNTVNNVNSTALQNGINPNKNAQDMLPVEWLTELSLSSIGNAEKITVYSTVSMTTPFYVTGKVTAANIALRRFMHTQGKRHKVSANMVFSASPASISLKTVVQELLFAFKGQDLNAKADITIQNEQVTLSNAKAQWGEHHIANIEGEFSVQNMAGSLAAQYAGSIAKKKTKTDIGISFTGMLPVKPPAIKTAQNGKNQTDANNAATAESTRADTSKFTVYRNLLTAFDQFTLVTTLQDWQFGSYTGENTKVPIIPFSIVREPAITALYAGPHDELTGFILNDGIVSLHAGGSLPLRFNMDGSIKNNVLDLPIRDIQAHIPVIWNIMGINYVTFHNGLLAGNMHIGGTTIEPLFTGKVSSQDIRVASPNYVPEIFAPINLEILGKGTSLEIPYTILKGPSADLWGQCTVEFTRWAPTNIVINCGTLKNKYGILKTDNVLFKAEGLAGCTGEIIITPTLIGVYGTAVFDSGYAAFKFNDLDKFKTKHSGNKSGRIFDMKLDLKFGQKAEFRWPSTDLPILQTLIPTEAPLTLRVNGETGHFTMTGNVKIRGGEVFYIKRNFYIREGSIKFVETGSSFEPLITIRAEIRERDENGEPIRLILTAQDQPLMSFNPTVNSDPPRSSQEIMQLLGQVLIGDASQENIWKNLLVSSTDVLAQLGFFKKTENKIRDFLRLDAFSFRTLLLQNAIFGNLFNANKETALGLSNYFDNTSVYIGKYFGSAIYADALLHLSHYNAKTAKNSSTKKTLYKNLLFQPEIGLEMATPFFMMRWSLAPSNVDTLFVDDAGLTFSWKYSY